MNGLSLSLYAIIRDNENAVGYMNGKETVNQNNFITAPFATVGYNTTDIQDIKLVGSGGWGTELFSVWEGLPSVAEGSEFLWVGTEWDENMIVATKGEWQDAIGAPAIFSVAEGQGVTINATSGIGVTTAGQVPVNKVEFTMIDGNNFTGNPFPAAIDIQNIKLVGSGGWGTELFSVWEGLPSVVEGSEFLWVGTEWDESMTVATKGEWQDAIGAPAVFSLNPCQGCVINGTAGIKVEITPPYELSK